MVKVTLLIVALISAFAAPVGNLKPPDPASRQPEQAPIDQASALHLTIASVGPLLGPPTNHYSVGEQVAITIGMTNTSSQPSYACVSSDLFQDLPRLTSNGRLIPYAKWQADLLRDSQTDQTCEHDDLPERLLLKANEPTMVDVLVLVDDSRLPTGALSWYDPLTPGVYELSIQRRSGCCDGPLIESNKISFEVVP